MNDQLLHLVKEQGIVDMITKLSILVDPCDNCEKKECLKGKYQCEDCVCPGCNDTEKTYKDQHMEDIYCFCDSDCELAYAEKIYDICQRCNGNYKADTGHGETRWRVLDSDGDCEVCDSCPRCGDHEDFFDGYGESGNNCCGSDSDSDNDSDDSSE